MSPDPRGDIIKEIRIDTLPGCEGVKDYYYIDKEGRVISYYKGRRRELSCPPNRKGYSHVGLRKKDGRRQSLLVHRLIAMAFISNPDGKEQVNHMDGDKRNNRISNLEWATNTENMRHSWAIGLREAKKGSDNYQWDGKHRNCKAVVKKDLKGTMLDSYDSIAIAARENGYKRAGISKACNGLIKTYMGHKWEFIT